MRPSSRSIASAGSPVSSTSPFEMIAIRLHRSLTSSTMWVERITTMFSPICDSRLWKRSRSVGSRPAVGSSTMISCGSPSPTLPVSGSCSVATMRISVLLPAPLGPRSPNMPVGIRSDTSCSARTPFG